MKRRIMNWFRVVFPFWNSLLIAVFFVQAVISGFAVFMSDDPLARPVYAAIGHVLTFTVAMTYPIYRVVAFHPLWRPDYLTWLQASPWTHRQKLPLGPVLLIPQDGVMLILLLALTWWWGHGLGVDLPYYLLAIVAISVGLYLATLAITLHSCGEWGAAYLIGFGLGGCAIWVKKPELVVALALGSYVVAYLGLKRSWRQFPWEGTAIQQTLAVFANSKKGEPIGFGSSANSLGWPFEWLSPKPERQSYAPLPDAILFSLLYGWCYLAVVTLVGLDSDVRFVRFQFATVASLVVLFFSSCRLAQFLEGFSAPLTLIGRFVTGRWLIPSYDRVWLPFFLLIFNLGLLGTAAANDSHFCRLLPWWDFKYFAAVWLAFMMWTQLTNAPPFRRWRVTAAVRLNPDNVWTSAKKARCVQCN